MIEMTEERAIYAAALIINLHPDNPPLHRAINRAVKQLPGKRWHLQPDGEGGTEIVIQSHSTPGKEHHATDRHCDCEAQKSICWHRAAYLIIATCAAAGLDPILPKEAQSTEPRSHLDTIDVGVGGTDYQEGPDRSAWRNTIDIGTSAYEGEPPSFDWPWEDLDEPPSFEIGADYASGDSFTVTSHVDLSAGRVSIDVTPPADPLPPPLPDERVIEVSRGRRFYMNDRELERRARIVRDWEHNEQ